jgi:hypothetical protein
MRKKGIDTPMTMKFGVIVPQGWRMHTDTTTWAYGMVSEWCGGFIDGDHKRFVFNSQ